MNDYRLYLSPIMDEWTAWLRCIRAPIIFPASLLPSVHLGQGLPLKVYPPKEKEEKRK